MLFTPITKSKSVIVTFFMSVVLLFWKAIDALGNVQFILQQLGVSERVARFLGSSRGIDFLVALSLLALVIVVAYQLKHYKSDSSNAAGQTVTPEQSDVEKALIECRSRLTELEHELTKSVERYDDTAWLRSLAAHQKAYIETYLRTDGWTADHSLVDEPLFIDFRLNFDSSSIYKLTATGLNGSIRIGNRRLGNATPNNYPPRIESNELQDLALGQIGYLTITQPLTRADAIFILNCGADFMFDGLFVELSATPAIQRSIKLSPHNAINNKELRDNYPKLDIKFKRAVYLYIPDRREPGFPELVNLDITLDVTLENLRNTKVEIDSAQVSLVNINQPTFRLQPDAGEIYERRFIDGTGYQILGDKLKNLASFPLSIIGRGKVSGCFQFTLEGVPIGSVKAKDTSASLILTDKYGEHHVGNHDLNHFV